MKLPRQRKTKKRKKRKFVLLPRQRKTKKLRKSLKLKLPRQRKMKKLRKPLKLKLPRQRKMKKLRKPLKLKNAKKHHRIFLMFFLTVQKSLKLKPVQRSLAVWLRKLRATVTHFLTSGTLLRTFRQFLVAVVNKNGEHMTGVPLNCGMPQENVSSLLNINKG